MALSNRLKSKDSKTILINIFSLGLVKFVDLIIPLLIIPILIKKVGFNNYGIYAFAFALIFYFINLVQYGFSLSAVRDISLSKGNTRLVNKIFNDVLSTQFFLTIISVLILIFLLLFIPVFNKEFELYLYLSLVLVGTGLSPNWLYQGMEKMKFITLINVISKGSFVFFIFIFIHSETDYKYIGLSQGFGYLIAGIISFIFAIKKFDLKFKLSNINFVLKQLQESKASFLTMITPLMYANTSVFLVGVFGTAFQVSFIEIGTKVSGAFSSLNQILTQVFYPFVNRKKEKSILIGNILIFCGLLLSIIMFFTAEPLINVWLSDTKNDTIILITKILSLSPFCLSLMSTYGVNGLLVLRKDNLYFKIILVCSVLGLLIGLVFIPFYFAIGAALTIIISRLMIGIVSYYFFKKVEA